MSQRIGRLIHVTYWAYTDAHTHPRTRARKNMFHHTQKCGAMRTLLGPQAMLQAIPLPYNIWLIVSFNWIFRQNSYRMRFEHQKCPYLIRLWAFVSSIVDRLIIGFTFADRSHTLINTGESALFTRRLSFMQCCQIGYGHTKKGRAAEQPLLSIGSSEMKVNGERFISCAH